MNPLRFTISHLCLLIIWLCCPEIKVVRGRRITRRFFETFNQIA